MRPPDVPLPCRGLSPGTPCPYPDDCICNREVSRMVPHVVGWLFIGLIALAIIISCIAIFTAVERAYGADNLPPCLTKDQARKKYPGAWLYWHTADHCWDNKKVGSNTRYKREPKKPKIYDAPLEPNGGVAKPIKVSATESVTVAYPSLMSGGGTEVAMLRADTITTWPLLMDFDDPPQFAPWNERINLDQSR